MHMRSYTDIFMYVCVYIHKCVHVRHENGISYICILLSIYPIN